MFNLLYLVKWKYHMFFSSVGEELAENLKYICSWRLSRNCVCGVGVGCAVCVLSHTLCDTQSWEHGKAVGCCAILENWFCKVTLRGSPPQPALTCKAGYFLVTTLSKGDCCWNSAVSMLYKECRSWLTNLKPKYCNGNQSMKQTHWWCS